MDLRQDPHRALGSLRPSRAAAEVRILRLPNDLVVGQGQGREGGNAFVKHLSRRDVLIIGAGAAASGAIASAFAQSSEGAERHGISSFGDLKYPAGFPHFDYADPKAP